MGLSSYSPNGASIAILFGSIVLPCEHSCQLQFYEQRPLYATQDNFPKILLKKHQKSVFRLRSVLSNILLSLTVKDRFA